MITYNDTLRAFHLTTKNTSYCIHISKTNHLLHTYYGAKLKKIEPYETYLNLPEIPLGSSTQVEDNLDLNITPLEIGTVGKGDYKEPTLHIEKGDGFKTLNLKYKSHDIIKNLKHDSLPQPVKDETLMITLKDTESEIEVNLYYTLYHDSDVLLRNHQIINNTKENIVINKALSMNLDLLTSDYDLISLDGAWLRERHITRRALHYGITKLDSKKGVSSSDHNPFFAIIDHDANLNHGNVYGFNLIYSGNFETNIEVSPHNLLRINQGMNSFDFKWLLKPKEMFTTPEAILTFTTNGLNKMMQNMHTFINTSITNNQDLRPIVYNNWEATYFNFNEKKLLAIAKQAKKLGIEVFCLDDGWFGTRDDDTRSLGDWHVFEKKLPKGLTHFSNKLKKLGLKPGLWVEPEMVNPNSDLYKNHPEWVVMHQGETPALGRNQLLLDLANDEVIDYLYNILSKRFKEMDVAYVKWDMNRNISDMFSQTKNYDDQNKYSHLYILGLYKLIDKLTTTFNHVLFESCSSGGNRIDLGMHFYMPQAWVSDNTDSYERLKIQSGTALAYPLSTISNHVSANISHQVLRPTPLESRFNVACFGVLGYEMDLRKRPRFETKVIKKQIEFYKQHRHLFQYGTFFNLTKSEHDYRFLVINNEQTEAILGMFQGLNTPNPPFQKIVLKGLKKDAQYLVTSRPQFDNLKMYGDLIAHALPIKLKAHGTLFNLLSNNHLYEVPSFEATFKGEELMQNGLTLPYRFTGSGYHEAHRILQDFSSRLYIIKEITHE